MPYVPPHLRNKAVEVEPAKPECSTPPRMEGSSGYVPPHLRNKKASDTASGGDDGPKIEVYTSDIIEVVEQPKKAGYVPPSMRKNEPIVVKKKAAELTEDDFPDLGAAKPAVVTGKSVAWGKKPTVAATSMVCDASQNSFALLSEDKEEMAITLDSNNKWSKKLDVTAVNEPVDEKVNLDDGKHIRITYDSTVRWWMRFASLPMYVPVEDRTYYDDYSNCTHIPHSGMTDYIGDYDDYNVTVNDRAYVYNEGELYEDESVY